MNGLSLNLLTLPVWWYTSGWHRVWQWNLRQMDLGLHQTGLLLFAHHMREPLYGDYTHSGIILSFFLRIILLLFKLTLLVVRALLLAVFDALYLAVLPLSVAMIIFQLLPAR